MAYPTAPGVVSYSGNYIPVVFSAKTLARFYEASVFGAIANTNHESEIKGMGDKVIIRTIPDMIVHEYALGQELKVDRPNSPPIELLIDKGYYWSYVVEDLNKIQFDKAREDEWTTAASDTLKVKVDAKILATIPPDAHAKNKGATAGAVTSMFNLGATGSPAAITKSNIIDYIIDANTVLSEQNRPSTGRWMVIPEWVGGLIQKSDLGDASVSGDSTSIRRNGRLGTISNFTLYTSNNVKPVTDGSDQCYNILFGDNNAITFATQLTKTEVLRSEKVFGDLIRGLQVYGFEVVDPKGFGVIYAKKG